MTRVYIDKEMLQDTNNTKASFDRLIKLGAQPTVSESFLQATILKTERFSAHQARVALVSSSLALLGSVSSFVYALLLCIHDLQATALGEFLSLLWTDTKVVSVELYEQFAFVLLDSIPLFSSTLLLLSLLFFVWAFRKSLASVSTVRLAV